MEDERSEERECVSITSSQHGSAVVETAYSNSQETNPNIPHGYGVRCFRISVYKPPKEKVGLT